MLLKRQIQAPSRSPVARVLDSAGGIILGKENQIRLALACLLARGHLLIEDLPGVGKTTLAHVLAKSLGLQFQRIQFTSDMLPADIIGVAVYERESGGFRFYPGPIFAQVILADEVNRATPKTQSALLEAMNEGQVTVEKRTFLLPRPFMVIATQNPVEFQGTFPLPESQMDRFMMRIRLGYPSQADEKEILRAYSEEVIKDGLMPVLSADDVLALQEEAMRVRVDESLMEYIISIADATRRSDNLALGVSPRGTLFLQKAARAMAMVMGRDYCTPDDIKELAVPVLSHRVMVNARGGYGRRGIDAEDVVRDIVETVEVPV